MKPAVILYKKLPDDLYARLAEQCDVTEISDLSPESQQKYAADFQQAEGLLGSGGKVNGELLAKMPNLRVCSSVSVGYDNFDVDALNQRGADAHADRADRNRGRHHDGAGAEHGAPGAGTGCLG
jgi:gluconate 2-dehydrogenase